MYVCTFIYKIKVFNLMKKIFLTNIKNGEGKEQKVEEIACMFSPYTVLGFLGHKRYLKPKH